MLRNDYRRALIMLRPLRRGMSGHVRLERRTLSATMRFTVHGAPSGTTQALLMAEASGRWVKYRLGALKNDPRGQSGMTASFDPRNLRGLDLDKYALVALVLADDGEVLMTGMVNGSKDVNWASAVQAASEEFAAVKFESEPIAPQAAQCCCEDATPEAAVEVAEQNETDAAPEVIIEVIEADGGGREGADEKERERGELDADGGGREDADEKVRESESLDAGGGREGADEKVREKGELDADGDGREDVDERERECDADGGDDGDAGEDEPGGGRNITDALDIEAAEDTDVAVETSKSENVRPVARELLNLAADACWPEDIEAVRELFETARASDAFRLDDFVFVDAPLPSEDGASGVCAIGLKARDGRPVSVCYALPGNYSVEPPPGLEDYEYLGGWWYTVLELL